ncbi:TylF/MycF/NovP-related O-methyltransferase [Paenibacillus sp. FSL W7-1279]|uniref:TylF/MycF/NovP-related O-methyltransferase n=1 Tax=Paenibacillus sp. FSL W7-1279 TaxID=2921697 RepID=UPI0030DDB924
MGEKVKVIIFGAGNGGSRVFYLLDQQYEVIAFADNNLAKQGRSLYSKPIISPERINNYSYDYIIIANLQSESIITQLVDDNDVSRDKIIDFYRNQMFDSRIASLRLAADEIYENQVQGNVAELGVYKGDFAKYINESFYDRKLYLFDTFNGFDEKDILTEKEGKFSNASAGEFKNEDVQLVLNKMSHPENCIVKKGYFPESAIDTDDSFAFVSLDVDLYGPILEGLRFFYPRLNEGGYIFIHDYNSTRFHGVKKAVREYCKSVNAKYVPISDICGSVIIVK